MKENLTILTIPLSQVNENYNSVWLGIPNIQTSIHVGLQRNDKSIWSGHNQYDNIERQWTNFINAWYIGNIYGKALENCFGITSGNPLLSRCSSVFKVKRLPYEFENTKMVLQLLPNGQKDVDELIEKLPPMEYIEKVVSIAEEECLLFDSSMLRVFLEKYDQIPLVLLEQLDSYDRWRKVDLS